MGLMSGGLHVLVGHSTLDLKTAGHDKHDPDEGGMQWSHGNVGIKQHPASCETRAEGGERSS